MNGRRPCSVVAIGTVTVFLAACGTEQAVEPHAAEDSYRQMFSDMLTVFGSDKEGQADTAAEFNAAYGWNETTPYRFAEYETQHGRGSYFCVVSDSGHYAAFVYSELPGAQVLMGKGTCSKDEDDAEVVGRTEFMELDDLDVTKGVTAWDEASN